MLSQDIISPPSSKAAGKKPPRTVHIDVYCTGSDAEDDSSCASGSGSPSISNDQLNEDESISTPQTVYDSNQMRLHHTRVDNRQDLPRRLGGVSTATSTAAQPSAAHTHRVTSPSDLREFLLSKSDTKDEVNESKQMLFNKHVGEHGQNARQGRFNGRNRFNFRKDYSDDCLSSNYPNSSRSTVRDFTCSSISSVLALDASSTINDDFESSWKETDLNAPDSVYPSSIAPSESFEYDNRRDRQRIRQMDERWGRNTMWRSPERERRWQQATLDDFAEEKEDVRNARIKNQPMAFENNYENERRTYQATTVCGPNLPPSYIPEEKAYKHNLVLNRSVSSTTSAVPSFLADSSFEKPRKIVFLPSRSSCSNSQTSSVLSRIAGYTMEHLQKARKFGTVVPATRKPGNHVGPAKNPDCQCDHCRRWMAERESGRERALSLGDIPFSRSTFWPGRHQ